MEECVKYEKAIFELNDNMDKDKMKQALLELRNEPERWKKLEQLSERDERTGNNGIIS